MILDLWGEEKGVIVGEVRGTANRASRAAHGGGAEGWKWRVNLGFLIWAAIFSGIQTQRAQRYHWT